MKLPFIVLTIWSKTPDKVKQMKNLDMFKQNLKEKY